MSRSSYLAGLDPRSKLLLQVGFVAAAYAHTEPFPLVLITAGTVAIARLSGQSLVSMGVEFRHLIVLLAFAPAIAMLSIRAPYVIPLDGREPALAAYRVLLLVLVSVAIVRTTTAREAEASIRWLVPGRPGRALGVGLGLVFRFMPVVRAEAVRTRQAVSVRGGDALSLHRRMGLVGVVAFVRLFRRADRVSQALRVRCLAWNATVPDLAFGRHDAPAIGVAAILLGWAVVG